MGRLNLAGSEYGPDTASSEHDYQQTGPHKEENFRGLKTVRILSLVNQLFSDYLKTYCKMVKR